MKRIKYMFLLAFGMALSMVFHLSLPSLTVFASVQPGEVKGLYVLEGSSQYTNGTLQLRYVGNNCYLFDLSRMEGNEIEDTAFDYELSGIFEMGADGIGSYEATDESKLKLGFSFDEQGVTVTEEDTEESLPVHLSGRYDFVSSSFSLSETNAVTILEFLPPAVTSLNESNRPYELVFLQEMVDEDFYRVKAIHIPTGTVIADFHLAWDLSKIYRVDNEAPILIFDSAEFASETSTVTPVTIEAASDAEEASYDAPLVVTVICVVGLMVAGVLLLVKKRNKSKKN